MLGFYNYTVLLTYLGAASGVMGVIFTLSRQSPRLGIICLMLSGLCDMFDGTVARTRVRTDDEKRFGVQIDSLSDLICFGVLPACIGYAVGLRRWFQMVIPVTYVLCALIRLAYFNVVEEHRQDAESGKKREQYEGLPVTTSALMFPFIFVMTPYFGLKYLPISYGVTMVAAAVAFVTDFKVKKADMKGMILMVMIGLAELILLVTGNAH